MEGTVVKGDFILINKSVYLFREPRRGDVVLFEYPHDPGKVFIRRVVGTPGDVIEGKDKEVFVNGKSYLNPHAVHREMDIIPREQNPRDNFGPVTVPERAYFVMGDNRDRSWDSRFWGIVKDSRIKGQAFIKYWSWDSGKSRVRWGSIGDHID